MPRFVPDDQALARIPGVMRVEHVPKTECQAEAMDLTHSVYPHDDVYGRFCTVQDYIACPPDDVFAYMADTRSLEEWSYSVRDLVPSEIPGVDVGVDRIGGATRIYWRTVSCREALTVDYHCAWDQGHDLWMVYLNRIVPADRVLGVPGSVVIWTNCRHPYYGANPYPELAPGRPVWVGDLWDWFYAGHRLELRNLKAILEHRHAGGLPVGPHFVEAS